MTQQQLLIAEVRGMRRALDKAIADEMDAEGRRDAYDRAKGAAKIIEERPDELTAAIRERPVEELADLILLAEAAVAHGAESGGVTSEHEGTTCYIGKAPEVLGALLSGVLQLARKNFVAIFVVAAVLVPAAGHAATSPCKGLADDACGRNPACMWVGAIRAADTSAKNGKAHLVTRTGYCRLRPGRIPKTHAQ